MSQTPSTEAQSDNQSLDPAFVLDYLQNNPGFFEAHIDWLTQQRLPHAERGSVSLVERQMERLRQDNQQLREEITALMTVARQNEAIYRCYYQLYPALLDCDSVQQLDQAMREHLMLPMKLSEAKCLTFAGHNSWLAQQNEFNRAAVDELLKRRLGDDHIYLGRLTQAETALLFESTDKIGSVALVGLADDLGLLVFASAQADHFQPQLDVLLLQQLQQLIGRILSRLSEASA